MSSFVPLHVQSHYSILHAIPTIDELIEKTLEYKYTALALTDKNNMHAVPEFGKKALSAGIKPIFGTQLDIMEESRFSRRPQKGEPEIRSYSLILLAKNHTGYQNLLKIISNGYDDGSFGRFNADKNLLKDFSEGLICLSSDYTGELWHHAHKKNIDLLHQTINFYRELFGKDNFFIELQDRNTSQDKTANQILIEAAQQFDVPLIGANPVKYMQPEDLILLDIVTCIKEKETMANTSPRNGTEYFKSESEMYELFKDIPEAVTNTKYIAESCESIPFQAEGDQSPQYAVPPGMTSEQFLRKKSKQALTLKFGGELPPKYQERLEWELDMICAMGFPNYFLVVSDFVQYAKKNGILVGPGRGSAAGALLSYALDITNIDPLKYDLLFERFLNPERVSMPDIDIDFEDERRDEVKEYLRTRYGNDKTADVVTFGYNKAKAVLKDVGRVLDIPLKRVSEISALIDANADLAQQSTVLSELKNILNGPNEQEIQWIRYSIQLANRIRNLGTHASALIVSGRKLSEIVPLYKDRSNTITTQFEGKYLEENGLLKMDILGLSNLGIIKDCLQQIFMHHHQHIDPNEIPLDDPKVFELFSSGRTAGIFQFESQGMTSYIKQLQPTNIEDLIAMNALYRPGPMDNIPSFIQRKHGLQEIDCYHPDLEPVLKNTYGIIVYQEQVMQIAQILSGFSLGEADVVRRIMAKKKPDELEKIRPQWINGAVARGYDASLAEHLFQLLIPFSNYAFNKSHAVAYSVLAYQTAWLKAHYPAEFMASLMSFNTNKHEDLAKYITEIRKSNIDVLAPDINISGGNFTVEYKNKIPYIRYGFNAIKGLGEKVSEEITRERKWGGKYRSVEDFVERTAQSNDIRKNNTEILIKAGAFDSLFDPKEIMTEKAIILNPQNLNMLYSYHEKKETDPETNFSLFSSEEIKAASDGGLKFDKNIPALTTQEEFQNEVKVFGFYFTGKLFNTIYQKTGKLSSYKDELKEILPLNTQISLLGYVSDINIVHGNRRPWGRFTLNTENDTVTLFLFGDKLEKFEQTVTEHSFILLKAQITERKNKKETENTVEKTYDVIDFVLLDKTPTLNEVHILLPEIISPERHVVLQQLQQFAKEGYQQKAHITIVFHINKYNNPLRSNTTYRIKTSPELLTLLDSSPFVSYWFL